MHISWMLGLLKHGYCTEQAALLISQINSVPLSCSHSLLVFTLSSCVPLSLVFTGIFQRPLAHTSHTITYPCTMPFTVVIVVPPSVSLPVSCPWRPQWDSTTQSYTTWYKLSLQELSMCLTWRPGGKDPAELCLQPCSVLGMDRIKLCSSSEDFPKVWWKPKHTAE